MGEITAYGGDEEVPRDQRGPDEAVRDTLHGAECSLVIVVIVK